MQLSSKLQVPIDGTAVAILFDNHDLVDDRSEYKYQCDESKTSLTHTL